MKNKKENKFLTFLSDRKKPLIGLGAFAAISVGVITPLVIISRRVDAEHEAESQKLEKAQKILKDRTDKVITIDASLTGDTKTLEKKIEAEVSKILAPHIKDLSDFRVTIDSEDKVTVTTTEQTFKFKISVASWAKEITSYKIKKG